MSESILIYGGKSFGEIMEDGGLGWWIVNQSRAEHLEYAVLTRCLTQEWATYDAEQGTAVMLCKLSNSVVKANDSNRKCIGISSYARINIPEFWQKMTNSQRNPFKYIDTDELLKELSPYLNKLEWQPFNG
ncbi:hypothetical protein F542_17970 [Bibersteinia trehalosi USDA-ARS-USMARC-188]|uniref:Uncharacterized protein n=2 Tax=Bibersteinia trehalosi TaxID=47735 RepID=A0A4V7IC52_BIBTR|nr:hypothetical protein [Bibersteinia trehalosi]UQX67994.1 hypothetical protein M3704_01955 [Mannheimia haemolytica]AGH37679.1 hypothetical protein WQG_3990 [Bibersteinia trehalosi USDA-ARS-USMARC-192]AHG82512.1 hypothetical protein F542_17970 [Bibersteinia trehalosi USDA-ARS-USMARC-188]AHG84846.1 hypothetical protein F543_19850 [Bibersteinia trehalosi USDA-ARS-USMARC-189]STY61724.1 Uncharacterised protein [Mannheimia haemolytica]